jgi:hypothetical protein
VDTSKPVSLCPWRELKALEMLRQLSCGRSRLARAYKLEYHGLWRGTLCLVGNSGNSCEAESDLAPGRGSGHMV